MTNIDQSVINKSQKGVRVDFQYFIQSAINQEFSWKTLAFFLTDLTTTPDKSKEVIKILVEELEKWVTKARNGDNLVIEEIDTVKENIIDTEGTANEVNGDYNQFDCDLNQEIENKPANEELIQDEIEPEASDQDKMQEQYYDESMSSSHERIQSHSVKEKLKHKVDAFKDKLYTFVGNENDEANKYQSTYDRY